MRRCPMVFKKTASQTDAGDDCAAVRADSITEPDGLDGITAALDQHARTVRAESILATLAGNVALVDIAQSGGKADIASFAQSGHRCPEMVGQFVGGVKLAYVPWCVDPQVGGDKRCDALQFGIGVVETRDDQGGEFEPDPLF